MNKITLKLKELFNVLFNRKEIETEVECDALEEYKGNKNLYSIAESLYKEARKTKSRQEIYGAKLDIISDIDTYSESEVIRIMNYIEVLCIADFDPTETYEYSTDNKYDPTFMDKFRRSDYNTFFADMTEELLGDKNG